MGSIIGTDQTIKPYTPAIASEGFTTEEIKKAIGGGYMELVRLSKLEDKESEADGIECWLYMIVDEEGLMKDLPLNLIATGIYHTYYRTNSPIVGPALLCTVTVTNHPDGDQTEIFQ